MRLQDFQEMPGVPDHRPFLSARKPDHQVAVAENHSPSGLAALHGEVVHERRLRPGAREVIRHHEVHGVERLESEGVQVSRIALQDPLGPFSAKSVPEAARHLPRSLSEWKREQRTVPSKAHVREMAARGKLDEQEHVGSGADLGGAGPNASRQGNHPEPERLERGPEQSVLLEAIAAATSDDELRLERLQVEPDRLPQQDVQVLEGEGGEVRPVQVCERVGAGFSRARHPRSVQVRVEVESSGWSQVPPLRVRTATAS